MDVIKYPLLILVFFSFSTFYETINSPSYDTNHKIDKDPVLKRGLVHIGAYPAPIARINKRYRWQIIMRIIDKKDYLNAYHALIDMLLKCYNTHNENISIDFRPTSLL